MQRFARLSFDGRAHYVEVDSQDRIRRLSAAPWLCGVPAGEWQPRADAAFLCPVTPSKILGIGRNYRAHASELGNAVPEAPMYFAKVLSSLLDPRGTVILPKESARVDYEAELGVVIGRRARHVLREQALEHVFGYTVVCDVTARDLQKSDGQWTRAKGFDTFCPVGPTIVTGIDVSDLKVQLRVNGELKQDGATQDMVFGVAELIVAISAAMTLEPGDLIATGTPEGVGPLAHGDRVVVSVQSVGELEFRVARS